MVFTPREGTADFRPEVWAAALMEPYQASLVYAQQGLVNREYIGEITGRGSSVRVSTIGKPTVKDYDPNADLETEDLDVTDVSYSIDQGSYINFRVEDVEALQAAGPLKDPAIRLAARGLAESADTWVGSQMSTSAKNKLGNVEIWKGNPDKAKEMTTATDALINLSEQLDNESVPEAGRFVVVGTGFYSALLRDPAFTRVDAAGTDQALRNGIIGRYVGMDILRSPNVPKTAGREHIIAGTPEAFSFAEQINKIEQAREEKRFADLVKGLMIYGGKAFRPEGLATLQADLKTAHAETPAG